MAEAGDNHRDIRGQRRPLLSDFAELVRERDGVLTREQLIGGGFSDDRVDGLLAAGHLTPIFEGVYITGLHPPNQRAVWRGGTLATARSFLAYRSTLTLCDLIDPIPGPVHVIREGSFGVRSQPNLRVHRTTRSLEGMTLDVGGIPSVHPMLALVQSAGQMGSTGMRKCLERAHAGGWLDLKVLDVALGANLRARNVGRLRVVAESFRPIRQESDSPLLSRFLHRWAARRSLLPAVNHPIGIFTVDCHWVGTTLIVEVDGWEAHRSRHSFDADRKRWSALTALGYDIVVVTARRLDTDEDGLFRQLDAIIARSGRQ